MPGSGESLWNKVKSASEGSTCIWSAEDGCHFQAPLPHSVGDQDHHCDGLLTHCFSARAGDELDSILAQQLWGNQPGEKHFQHYAEVESTQMGKLMDVCPLILRELLKQRWIC